MAEVASLSSGDEAASWGGSEERETDSRDEGDAGREAGMFKVAAQEAVLLVLVREN